MKLAMVGLGRMGGNMAQRLLRAVTRSWCSTSTPTPAPASAAKGATPADTLAAVVDAAGRRRGSCG